MEDPGRLHLSCSRHQLLHEVLQKNQDLENSDSRRSPRSLIGSLLTRARASGTWKVSRNSTRPMQDSGLSMMRRTSSPRRHQASRDTAARSPTLLLLPPSAPPPGGSCGPPRPSPEDRSNRHAGLWFPEDRLGNGTAEIKATAHHGMVLDLRFLDVFYRHL